MKISNLLLCALLAATPARAQVPARTIEISTALSPEKAVDAIKLAALRGGWGVKSSDGGVITLETFTPKAAGALNVLLRANVIGSDSISTVVISGLWGSKVRANGEPTEAIDSGPFSRINRAGPASWAELGRFADAVRAAVK